jgi:sugar lactone lactonase YvrE
MRSVKPDTAGRPYDQIRQVPSRATTAILLSVTFIAACQPSSSSSRQTPPPTATASRTCPAQAASAGGQVILSGLASPDDLAFDAEGRLLFGDIKKGTVSRLSSTGVVEQVGSGLQVPEGIALRPDGRLLVAEQGRNRIVLLDPANQAVTLWRAFANRTGREGIDGIGLDPITAEVIVPDSPNGILWRVSPDGATARRIGAGMTRPVGAVVDQQEAVLVADEGGSVWRFSAPFQQRRVARLAIPDDVVVDHNGNLFVNTLGDGSIHMIDPAGNQSVVVRGLQTPQGLALDGAGNIFYTDTGGSIGRLARTFFLDQATVTRSGQGLDVVCPALRRAAGYTDPLELSVVPATGVSVVSLVQPSADQSGRVEVRRAAGAPGYVDLRLRAGLLEIRQRVPLP